MGKPEPRPLEIGWFGRDVFCNKAWLGEVMLLFL